MEEKKRNGKKVREGKGALLTETKKVRVCHGAFGPGKAHVDGRLALAAFLSDVVEGIDELGYQLFLGVNLPLRHLFVRRHLRSHHDYSARRTYAELVSVDLSCYTRAMFIAGTVLSVGSEAAA